MDGQQKGGEGWMWLRLGFGVHPRIALGGSHIYIPAGMLHARPWATGGLLDYQAQRGGCWEVGHARSIGVHVDTVRSYHLIAITGCPGCVALGAGRVIGHFSKAVEDTIISDIVKHLFLHLWGERWWEGIEERWARLTTVPGLDRCWTLDVGYCIVNVEWVYARASFSL
ncbi:hypothetical protein D9758_015831 [Tetrapyrgos nigripes]|uniref:Uncharacterized protein n=1 Tax=Tetrapyrgos nigripes TaxID=182062 RepID=A0A8H5FKW0_9AGAR|nr:hypothetical protein D9758_015831 [Tetrapyrgos nigripes]